jgi:hypothetical protein
MPPGWGETLAFAKEWGAPLAALVLFAIALLFKRKRKRDGIEIEGAPLLVPGWQLDAAADELVAVRKARSDFEHHIRTEAAAQVAYVEARRAEERAARMASDERLGTALEIVREQGRTLDELRIDVARLTGTRRPTGPRERRRLDRTRRFIAEVRRTQYAVEDFNRAEEERRRKEVRGV